MISFREFCLAEGILWDADVSNPFNGGIDWKYHHNPSIDNRCMLLLEDKNQGHRIYKFFNTYYMTDLGDVYMGLIKTETKNLCAKIKNSESMRKGGFYGFMFECILSKTDIKCIYSDNEMSKSSIASWVKLSKGAKFDIKIENYDGSDIAPSQENYLIHPINVFRCTLK